MDCPSPPSPHPDPEWDPKLVSELDWQQRARFIVSDVRVLQESCGDQFAQRTLPSVLKLKPSSSMDGVSAIFKKEYTRNMRKQVHRRRGPNTQTKDGLDHRWYSNFMRFFATINLMSKPMGIFGQQHSSDGFSSNPWSMFAMRAGEKKRISVRRDLCSSTSTLTSCGSVSPGFIQTLDESIVAHPSRHFSQATPLDLTVSKKIHQIRQITAAKSFLSFYPECTGPSNSSAMAENLKLLPHQIYNKGERLLRPTPLPELEVSSNIVDSTSGRRKFQHSSMLKMSNRLQDVQTARRERRVSIDSGFEHEEANEISNFRDVSGP